MIDKSSANLDAGISLYRKDEDNICLEIYQSNFSDKLSTSSRFLLSKNELKDLANEAMDYANSLLLSDQYRSLTLFGLITNSLPRKFRTNYLFNSIDEAKDFITLHEEQDVLIVAVRGFNRLEISLADDLELTERINT